MPQPAIDSSKARTLDDRNTHDSRVLHDLEGPLCTRCGNASYILVFRVAEGGHNGTLAARCRCCREPRELMPGEIERECKL